MKSILPGVVSNASARRRGVNLVGPVDLTVSGPGTTMIIGPNGSGKTSLLRMMHGLERVRSGTVSWAVPTEQARQHQAFVFQTPILMRRSVVDCIAYPLIVRGVPKKQARVAAAEWAQRVNLGDTLKQPASSLSGGERQKMTLARALVIKPELLFLDEPCASLDGRSTREIEDLLAQARADGTTIVMSTHDLGQARRMADDVVLLLHGRIHETGKAQEFFHNPSTDEGKSFLAGGIVE